MSHRIGIFHTFFNWQRRHYVVNISLAGMGVSSTGLTDVRAVGR